MVMNTWVMGSGRRAVRDSRSSAGIWTNKPLASGCMAHQSKVYKLNIKVNKSSKIDDYRMKAY